jgi:hypothetical protein
MRMCRPEIVADGTRVAVVEVGVQQHHIELDLVADRCPRGLRSVSFVHVMSMCAKQGYYRTAESIRVIDNQNAQRSSLGARSGKG